MVDDGRPFDPHDVAIVVPDIGLGCANLLEDSLPELIDADGQRRIGNVATPISITVRFRHDSFE
ncbi:MAG: hypothetical protein ACLQRH_02595 [Acidimicrobiales bacterium]